VLHFLCSTFFFPVFSSFWSTLSFGRHESVSFFSSPATVPLPCDGAHRIWAGYPPYPSCGAFGTPSSSLSATGNSARWACPRSSCPTSSCTSTSICLGSQKTKPCPTGRRGGRFEGLDNGAGMVLSDCRLCLLAGVWTEMRTAQRWYREAQNS